MANVLSLFFWTFCSDAYGKCSSFASFSTKQSTYLITHLLLVILMPRASLALPLVPAFRHISLSMAGIWGSRSSAVLQLKMANSPLLCSCPFIHPLLHCCTLPLWNAPLGWYDNYNLDFLHHACFSSSWNLFPHQLENHLSVSHFMWYFGWCPLAFKHSRALSQFHFSVLSHLNPTSYMSSGRSGQGSSSSCTT